MLLSRKQTKNDYRDTIVSCTPPTTSVSSKDNFCSNLTNYAIESRRIRNPCIYETTDINYFSCINKLTHNHPSYSYYPQRPQYFRPDTPHNIMDVLYTISKNDALRCVPRLLCEVTSDTISKSRQGFSLPTLPFSFDVASIIRWVISLSTNRVLNPVSRLLASIDLPGGSPVPVFAKAALLGYVSKGNSDSCLSAYPLCPREPDKLVQYLNNYNGGFFRYFNGVNSKPHQTITITRIITATGC